MPTGKWLTPDSIPGTVICRPLFIPDDVQILAAVMGALEILNYETSWQSFGAVTPAAIAAAMQTMYQQAFVEGCNMGEEIDLFRHEENQNVAGGGISAGNNTRAPFNTADSQNAGNVTLDTNEFVLSAGRYYIRLEHSLRIGTLSLQKCWLGDGVNGSVLAMGFTLNQAGGSTTWLVAEGIVNTEFEYTVSLWVRSTVAQATNGFGLPQNTPGLNECYGLARIVRLSDFVQP